MENNTNKHYVIVGWDEYGNGHVYDKVFPTKGRAEGYLKRYINNNWYSTWTVEEQDTELCLALSRLTDDTCRHYLLYRDETGMPKFTAYADGYMLVSFGRVWNPDYGVELDPDDLVAIDRLVKARNLIFLYLEKVYGVDYMTAV